MQSAGKILIDLRQAAQQGQILQQELADDFFEALEQDEIIGGRVCVSLCVKENASECFLLRFHIQGEVVVACDRCLAPLSLPVDTEAVVRVCADDSFVQSDEDVKALSGNGYAYDIAWDIYENTLLALPLQRTHPIAECDADMLTRIAGAEDEEAAEASSN